MSPELRQAVRAAQKAGYAYVVLDGTLIPVDRVAADRPFYSGKHTKHGMNLQVIADPHTTPACGLSFGFGSLEGLADVVAGGRVAVLRAGWAVRAGLAGFGAPDIPGQRLADAAGPGGDQAAGRVAVLDRMRPSGGPRRPPTRSPAPDSPGSATAPAPGLTT